VCFRFDLFFPRTGKQEKTKNAVYDENDVSDVSGLDTERTSIKPIVRDGKPGEKKREKGKENTDSDDPGTSRKVEKIETESCQNSMYFIF